MAPGYQPQIDFGEKWVEIGGLLVRVFFFVAVLGYSRRIYVRASLRQRQDDWREGLAGAFRAFGGVTQRILIDRAGALVIGQDRETGTARIHPHLRCILQGLGRGGLRVPTLPGPHQGQDQVWRRLRQAQRDRQAHV